MGKDGTVHPLKQEELPLDPDEIGEPVEEVISATACTCTSYASQKSTPTLDDSLSRHSVSENQMIEAMDTNVSGETSIDLTLPSLSENSLSTQAQSVRMSCDTKVSKSTPVRITTGEYLARMETIPVQPVVDLTVKKNEHNGSEDQYDDFMDDLSDEDFCTSFTNFDDDDNDDGECEPSNFDDNDKEYVPSNEEDDECEGEESGSSDDEKWRGDGVDYVKTVAEMAEEVDTSDLFDPKVLGKLSCMIIGVGIRNRGGGGAGVYIIA